LLIGKEEEGFVLADSDVKVVVASVDRDVNFEKVKIASRLIRSRARYFTSVNILNT
jgi:ribonucleotide monophosphatase NagD (HAD superfamily)